MSTNTIESLLGSSQSQCRAEMLESQGDTPRNEEGRLQRRVRKKYPRDDEVDPAGTAKIDYATSILKSYDRATDRYIKLEIDLMGALADTSHVMRESMDTDTVQIGRLEADTVNSSSVMGLAKIITAMDHSDATSHVSYQLEIDLMGAPAGIDTSHVMGESMEIDTVQICALEADTVNSSSVSSS